MMRVDALNLHVDPVRPEIIGMQQITILHVFDSEKRKSKDILADETLSQVCSTIKRKSESFMIDESSI